MELEDGTRFQVLAPVVRGRKGEYGELLRELQTKGYSRARVDGTIVRLDEALTGQLPTLKKYEKHDIEVIVDRLAVKDNARRRLTDSVETALGLSGGVVILDLVDLPEDDPHRERMYSEHLACLYDDLSFDELEPRSFSFNSPWGACPDCTGLGTKLEVDPELIVPDESKSLAEGALAPWSSGHLSDYFERLIEALAETIGFRTDTPWAKLPAAARQALLRGHDGQVHVRYKNRYGRERSYYTTFEGVIRWVERRHAEAESDSSREKFAGYMREVPCPSCGGAAAQAGGAGRDRGRPVDRRAVRAARSATWPSSCSRSSCPAGTSRSPGGSLKEVNARLGFLLDVGLDYLTLDRGGGDAGRRRGPADPAGHPDRLGPGRGAVRAGRAVHRAAPAGQPPAARDAAAAAGPGQHADRRRARRGHHPGRGLGGGHRAAGRRARRPRRGVRPRLRPAGQPGLADRRLPDGPGVDPGARHPPGRNKKREVTVKGASEHNLRGVDVAFPLGCLVAVTGVSGSGKSTLVNDILYRALARELNGARTVPGKHVRVTGMQQLDKVVHVDQGPIGRTPRSNPATYTGVFDHVRKLFAATTEAKIRGYQPGRFSFNVKGGRCEACSGDGTIKIEMQFLPDVYVPCEVCHGARYNTDTLQVHFKGKTIAEVLDMPIEEASEFFEAVPAIHRHLKTLVDVGLGYVRLGQPAPTLSGGEAQRVKLASELQKRATGRTIYVLDEPTTGLHFEDIRKLLGVLTRLVETGNTVIVIEHNLDVIKTADWVIDLGPEGGRGGGMIVAAGPPEQVATVGESYTGQFLKKLLDV